jgi:hypothetical protein
LVKIIFLDVRVRPHRTEDLVLRHDVAAALDEHEQRVDRALRHRDERPLPEEHAVGGVETELVEGVNTL